MWLPFDGLMADNWVLISFYNQLQWSGLVGEIQVLIDAN